ncbi:hypothetical protein COV20_03570 [Candidatus Woesearchaeota archaeon CG10_big_fil_rev_8_21_14_0_10_45_16]|nr:MAG: hypothetical protein COV20_03570 [Candidatus Woesearchaeota archaeon CG10_big_fil_rev_8_21_14_0_10_45_16]
MLTFVILVSVVSLVLYLDILGGISSSTTGDVSLQAYPPADYNTGSSTMDGQVSVLIKSSGDDF